MAQVLESRSRLARAARELTVLLFASAIFLVSIVGPPSLVDDVDSVQPQISRTMLESGDWVTARLDGIPYLEKAPLKYWLIAVCFGLFGVHDWAARLPVALSAVLLCWVVFRFARWAMGSHAGFYAGMCLGTCVGLFLFTRVLIPDVMLTLAITVTVWAFIRATDPSETSAFLWAMAGWVGIAAGILLKGFIGAVFPVGIAGLYLLVIGQLWNRENRKRLHLIPGVLLMLALAAPWHVLATIRNPPYFDLTMHSEPGSYRGFFWFYFINEQVLRFLNRRWPRDYNTVPRVWFWLFHVVWFFPWSVYFPAIASLGFKGDDRASRLCVLCLCWIGVVMAFFTFSTTQEYYSLPCYPAIAILVGASIAARNGTLRLATKAAGTVAAIACIAFVSLLVMTRGLPAAGDISRVLTQNEDLYTLSLGHMSDLTFQAFAYLRIPLALAALAAFLGAAGAWLWRGPKAFLSLAVMMVLFFQAARLAQIAFNPYLGSRPLAEALLRSPEGRLIVDDQYYTFSSVFFYTNRTALLLNGRKNNLEYGSYAPGAPQVFLNDEEFQRVWRSPERYYVVAEAKPAERLRNLVSGKWNVVKESGGKILATNQPLP